MRIFSESESIQTLNLMNSLLTNLQQQLEPYKVNLIVVLFNLMTEEADILNI